MRRLSSISLSLLLLMGLSGCGQKGPLTLPPEPKSELAQAQ